MERLLFESRWGSRTATATFHRILLCDRVLTAVSVEGLALHLLFVCTGNICRSPTAERLAAAYGAQRKIANFSTSSAGLRAVVGSPVHHSAALVLERLGGQASAFAARQLSPNIASAADLILTMTRDQRDAVLERSPHLLRRTFTLSEAARLAAEPGVNDLDRLAEIRTQLPPQQLLDIADPIGRGPEVFEAVGVQIAGLLPSIVDLCRRASIRPTD